MTRVIVVSTPDDGTCGIGTYAGELAREIGDDADLVPVTVPLRSLNPLPYVAGALRAGLADGDVVHVQHEYGIYGPKSLWSFLFFPILWLLSTLRGRPVVLTLHSAWNDDTIGPPLVAPKRVYVALNNRLLAATAEHVNFLSANARDRFLESVPLPDGRYDVLPHGVQTDTRELSTTEAKRILDFAPEDTLVVEPGYVRPEKGQLAFVDYADAFEDVEFVVAGGVQADEDEGYMDRVRDAAGENVTITGVLDDEAFHATFQAADLVVLPYDVVTQSGIFNWCAAYECATAASDEPYFQRLLDDWDCVELFDADDRDDAVGTIERLLDDPDRRDALATAAADYQKANSLGGVADDHVALYRSLANA